MKSAESPKMTLITQLDAEPNVSTMLQAPIVKKRFLNNYLQTTGKKDGQERYNEELMFFLEIVRNSPKISKCDRLSVFLGFVSISTYGLSFRDDQVYAITRWDAQKGCDVLSTKPGANGKVEMMRRMKSISFIYEPFIILKGEEFQYDYMSQKVLNYKPKQHEAFSLKDIIGAVMRIEFSDGRQVDVYMNKKDLDGAYKAAKTKNVWDGHPGEMCKKSVKNRAYKVYFRREDLPFKLDDNFDDSVDDDIKDTTYVEVKEEPTKKEPETPEETVEEIPHQEAQIVEEQSSEAPEDLDAY